METELVPSDEVFLDATYAIALAADSDQYHRRAVAISDELEASGAKMVTTRAVVLEIGNALAKLRYRAAAVDLLRALESDPSLEIVELSEVLYHEGLDLFCRRADKQWSITDCVSFLVMDQRGLSDALTADEHFRQAGFRPLLRE